MGQSGFNLASVCVVSPSSSGKWGPGATLCRSGWKSDGAGDSCWLEVLGKGGPGPEDPWFLEEEGLGPGY